MTAAKTFLYNNVVWVLLNNEYTGMLTNDHTRSDSKRRLLLFIVNTDTGTVAIGYYKIKDRWWYTQLYSLSFLVSLLWMKI